jgi:hypothetical protein
MTVEECKHGLGAGTCSICKGPDRARASQATLSFGSIKVAVDDLASQGDFRTKDVASHQALQDAHPTQSLDPSFNQHIGMYLTDAVGRLRIEQVSPKGQSNAIWRTRS